MKIKATNRISLSTIILIIVILGFSCNKNLKISKISKENDLLCIPLEINGKIINIQEEEIPDYYKKISDQIEKEVNLDDNLSQIFYTETWDGGNGIYDAIMIIFNDEIISSYKIEYEFEKRKIQLRNIQSLIKSDRDLARIKHLFRELEQNAPWTLDIECDSFTTEQFLTFYLKKNNKYLYYFEFNNHHFTLNPTLRIDENMVELVYLVRKSDIKRKKRRRTRATSSMSANRVHGE